MTPTVRNASGDKWSDLRQLGKQLIPSALQQRLKTSRLYVRYRSRWTNVYHCTVYRTGSQWLRRILSDRVVFRYSGLQYEMVFQRIFSTGQVKDQTVQYPTFPYPDPFPEKRIIGLYASSPSFQQVPCGEPSRAFFVLRDPRDIVVSHYFAWRRDARNGNSPLYDQIKEPQAGILQTIHSLDQMALLSAIQSWVSIQKDDPHILLLRYEDLTGPQQLATFQKLFAHCDIRLSVGQLRRLLTRHSFEALSGGRQPGVEDPDSHYRKGVPGDWLNHFTPDHIALFRELTGNLVTDCGYSW